MKTRKRKETITIEVEDFVSDSGKVLKNLSKNELIAITKSGARNKSMDLRSEALALNKKHTFKSFKIDNNLLTKYSESSKIYPHFVYYHLREWSSNCIDSRHYTNGGNWQHFRYDPELEWHITLVDNMKKGKIVTDHNLVSIRDSVLIHFYSGGVIRMYGTNQYYKTIRDFESPAERKQFFNYILDSGMVSINKKEPIKTLSSSHDKFNYLSNEYNTLGEAFVDHCIRNDDFDTFKWLVEKKGLDLYCIDKEVYGKKGYYEYKSSFLYRLVDNICCSNYEYEFKKNFASSKSIKFLKKLFQYINNKFPNLKILGTQGKIVDKKNAITQMAKLTFGTYSYDQVQTEKLQQLFFGK